MRLNGTTPDLGKLRALYQAAFPSSEKKPFSMIEEKRREGLVEVLSIEGDDGEFLGLAITALYGDLALLDYFAIAEDKRGGGIGGEALRMLQARYADRRMFIEIETTMPDEGEEVDNLPERIRRKAFYQRNGMVPLPYLVNLFGVEMEMLSAGGKAVGFEEYHEMYEAVYHTSKFVRLVREL